MFTICPDCSSQFRISAGQLSAARGQVRCGQCGRQFSALETLSDKPSRTGLKDRLQEARISSPRTAHDTDSFEQEPQFDIPVNGPAVETAPLPDESTGSPGTDLSDEPMPDDLPEDLREPPPRKKGRYPVGWTLIAVVLLLVIGGQAAWFHRDALLQRYPQLQPRVQQLCERIDCRVYRYRDISAIRIINRDVRIHPAVDGALLVNATMTNQADRVQPFPGIQLSLFDTNGAMIATREFIPDEYLDRSITIGAGMSPQQPVHFVLEVTGPVEGAVSFEFRFM